MDESRNALLSDFGQATLRDRYLLDKEGFQNLFARVACAFADDQQHAQRLYDYMSKLWFTPATPILSNGGTKRGMPISCFVNEINDSLKGIADIWMENVWLAARGGGIGSYWGHVRSINEKVGNNGKTSGIMPFIKVQDSLTLAISQGSLRRGSSAVYLPIHHPEIEEFVDLRRPTGGDINRRALNIHHGVVITDKFMHAVEMGENFDLLSPHDGSVVFSVPARDLWIKILTARMETGEPYMLFIDNVNKSIPEHHKKLGLNIKTSNLCSEITLPTGLDHLDKMRTAVCCLSSVNLEYFQEWHGDSMFIIDIMKFLDNVLQYFIDHGPSEAENAKYSAYRERSVGLGVMGFHSFLQSKSIPIESVMAKVWNEKIFKHLSLEAKNASLELGRIKGPCPDAKDAGSIDRFSNTMAVAPTASISIIANNTSPGIEPYAGNTFVHKTLSGTFVVRNRHLEQILESKGLNNEQTWSSIATHEGSVQHLECLSQHEKDVFKTAYELDQRWLISHAADRTPFISQAQSLNLFFRSDVHKKYLHDVHFNAWKKGNKSLYYLRTQQSVRRAEKVFDQHEVYDMDQNIKNEMDECLSCQ